MPDIGYTIYFDEMKRALGPSLDGLKKIVSNMWQNLNPKQKSVYETKARDLKSIVITEPG